MKNIPQSQDQRYHEEETGSLACQLLEIDDRRPVDPLVPIPQIEPNTLAEMVKEHGGKISGGQWNFSCPACHAPSSWRACERVWHCRCGDHSLPHLVEKLRALDRTSGAPAFTTASRTSKTPQSVAKLISDDQSSKTQARSVEEIKFTSDAKRQTDCDSFQSSAKDVGDILLCAPSDEKDTNSGETESDATCSVQIERVFLDAGPQVIRRPVCLIEGRSYAVTWVWPNITTQGWAHTAPCQVVLSQNGLFTDVGFSGASPLETLPISIALSQPPPLDRIWSGHGVNRWLAGQRPHPARVFGQIVDVVDRFIDFDRSLAEQSTMCELVGCFVLSTYLLDAFNVAGYLWPNGERGCGKSNLLALITEMGYLGTMILAGGSYATIRDLADYGACLAFDDCERIMERSADPDKRALLLAGNRRGVSVTVKEPTRNRKWTTRYVNAYCPRLFSAIQLPDPVLASRSITVPLVRSADPIRANANPLDHSMWPHDRRRLVDDLWAIGLNHLPELPSYDTKLAQRARLNGRNLEPWRSILAVALWLQEAYQVPELFDRIEQLSHDYQKERSSLELTDVTRLLIVALQELFSCQDAVTAVPAMLEVGTSEITDKINRLAVEFDAVNDFEQFTNPKRVGRLLERLRFEKGQRTDRGKRWRIRKASVDALATTYAISDEAITSLT